MTGAGTNAPFSDRYNSSTAKHVMGMIDMSWFPTSFSTNSPTNYRYSWMNVFNMFALGKQTGDRIMNVYDINTRSIDPSLNEKKLEWHLLDSMKKTCVVVGEFVDPGDPSVYDTTLYWVNRNNDTLVETRRASINK